MQFHKAIAIALFSTGKVLTVIKVFIVQVRSVLGDFAVLVAIVLWTSVDLLLALDTPKLNVPTEIKPTSATRSSTRHTHLTLLTHTRSSVFSPTKLTYTVSQ